MELEEGVLMHKTTSIVEPNIMVSEQAETIRQINQLQEELNTETKRTERIAIRIIIFMMKMRISRKTRIIIDIFASVLAFFALIYAPLGFILYVILLCICADMEGVCDELPVDDGAVGVFFLIEIILVCLVGYYTSATVFVVTYVIVHIGIIILKELAVFTGSST